MLPAEKCINFTELPDAPSVRVYHSRAVITKEPKEAAQRGGPVVSRLVWEILDIPGVCAITASAYEVALVKAEMYSWDEIHPVIWKILLLANTPEGKAQ